MWKTGNVTTPAKQFYFDANATTPLSAAAEEAWLETSRKHWHNPSSLYHEAAAASQLLEDAREAVRKLTGAMPLNVKVLQPEIPLIMPDPPSPEKWLEVARSRFVASADAKPFPLFQFIARSDPPSGYDVHLFSLVFEAGGRSPL